MVAGNITPSANNTYLLGNDTGRWKEIYGVSIYSGDIILENKFRITEVANGIAFKDNNHNALLTIANNSIEASKPFRVNMEANEPFGCDSSRKAYMYFDTTANAFKGCNGSEWKVLG